MEDKDLLQTMVTAMVSKPEAVKIERKVDEMGVLLELTIDQTDMGTIIGKEGRTAKALRTILRAFGAKNNARINLKIIEPEGSTFVRRERPTDSEGGE
ncbi:KH domain-containing protein [Candidatus Microgenomates bacterium]|nr:KH domain-containing protein [Candidatus Microgenomates bacterium]